MKQSYNEYLKGKHWRNLREDAFRFYGRHCFYHPETTKHLEVHHIKYKPDLSDCRVKDVVPLCRCCHYEVHQSPESLKKIKEDTLSFYRGKRKRKGQKKKTKSEKNPEGVRYIRERSERFKATGNKKANLLNA
jgi:hypothetical protein